MQKFAQTMYPTHPFVESSAWKARITSTRRR